MDIFGGKIFGWVAIALLASPLVPVALVLAGWVSSFYCGTDGTGDYCASVFVLPFLGFAWLPATLTLAALGLLLLLARRALARNRDPE